MNCFFFLSYFQGDQGGPLLCKSESSWFQAAVVSVSGGKSARADLQVFAKASTFGSFLKEIVGDMPSPETTATGNVPSFAISSFLLITVPITSVLLLS